MTVEQADTLAEAKNLFAFLAEVQRIREAPVRSYRQYDETWWLDEFPAHPAIASALDEQPPAEDAPILTIDRIASRPAPKPSDELAQWMGWNLDDANAEPRLREWVDASRVPHLVPRVSVEGPAKSVFLEDEPELRSEGARYLTQWREWAEQEKADRPVRDLYADLFSAYQTVISHGEASELVLGVGVIDWVPAHHDQVERHLLTFPVTLEFDETTGRLTALHDTGSRALSVELDMLDPALVTAQVSELRTATLAYEGHPLDHAGIKAEVVRFAHALDSNGAYLDERRSAKPTSELRSTFSPALVLRRRSQRGLLEIFQTIGEQLESMGEVPPGLLPLVDPDHLPTSIPDETPGGIVEIDNEIFLPLPVNERQLQVITAVDHKAQVVVQGPPGTGKTHTAAALLSHLLAQGKRVLVTAHTDRALHEVRDKLPEEIRPLSVAVVGSSQTEMADLRVAVDTITRMSNEHDSKTSSEEIARHLAVIDRLRRERADTYTRLRQSREAVTTPTSFGAYQGSVAAIARQIAETRDVHGWVVEYVDVAPQDAVPLTDTEAIQWLALLSDADVAADGAEAQRRFPALEQVPSVEHFAGLAAREGDASVHSQAHEAVREHPLYAVVAELDPAIREALHSRTSDLAKLLGEVEDRSEGWVADAFRDVRTGRGSSWRARAEQVRQLVTQAHPHVSELGPLNRVEVAGGDFGTLVLIAEALLAYLDGGGEIRTQPDGTPKVGFRTAKVVKQSQAFFDSVRVNQIVATTPQNVRAFLNHVHATRILDALDQAWPANVEIPAEDTLGERLQWHKTELEQLGAVLATAAKLAETEGWVKQHGLSAPNWADLEAVSAYADLVDAATTADELDQFRRPLEGLSRTLEAEGQWEDAAPVTAAMRDAVAARDRNAYASAHARLTHLHDVRARIQRRDEIGTRLEAAAPALAAAVTADPHAPQWPQHLTHLDASWRWAAASAWAQQQERLDANALHRHLDLLENQLRQEISALAAARAWSHAVDETRMTGTAKAFLSQYSSLVKRLGKGTGKYATKRRQEIKQALDECRSSVPVWIMPIYRIAEQFRIESNMFDVIVVDEASQAGLEASFLQYLAPKIVVIGDDKQVSPTAVGVDQQQLRNLADQYLRNNKFKASWQDPQRSYFDEADMRFGGKITLIEHRRCVPEIIGFSNKVAYEPENIRLLPVRQRTAGALTPIRSVHVPEGYEKGRINPAEADALVAQLIACLHDPAYEGKTFGVISLMGKEQAKAIETRLMLAVNPEDWAARQLRCGDAADFQGSERDVMFLSMVKTAESGKRVGSLTMEMYVQRYNVAVSRAKDQMWLFHSLLLSDLGNPEDMRHALLDYVTNVEARASSPDDRILQSAVPDDVRVEPFDSLFEQRVFNRVHGRGYSVIAQYPDQGYRIDLVVVGVNGNLAIECDGDHWHGPDAYYRDLARQRDLERCGWTFFRIRESDYYLDPDAALAGLWPLLEELTTERVGPGTVPAAKLLAPSVTTYAAETEADLDDLYDAGEWSEDVSEKSAWAEHLAVGRNHVASARSDTLRLESRSSSAVPSPTLDVHPPAGQSPAAGGPYAGGGLFEQRGVAANSNPEGTVSDVVELRYEGYRGTTVMTDGASVVEIINSLVEVVAVEGPVRGAWLHSTYVRAHGGQKVGSKIARVLNSAIATAVRRGQLVEENPLGEAGVKPRTYRLPDQPAVRVRPLGGRSVHDVPPAELAQRIASYRQKLGNSSEPRAIYRAVLNELGLTKLTPNVEETLERADSLNR
ncbi:AAA domain-containing protein [Nocardioides dubius]|uniref:AAA family ATPase n=1 Tax=Nocardioides dubius TaxID=317019 RepID=A0ABN1TJ90_9ACTN